jgi:hypothetical protein
MRLLLIIEPLEDQSLKFRVYFYIVTRDNSSGNDH